MKFRVQVLTPKSGVVTDGYIDKIDQTFWPGVKEARKHAEKLLENTPVGTVIRGYETVENLVFEVGPVEGKK
jgi:hypothetical protein